MFPESSRAADPKLAIASDKDAITAGIVKATGFQARESIDRAIKCFDWAFSKDKKSNAPDWSESVGQTAIQVAGFTDSPLNYLSHASKHLHKVGPAFLVPSEDMPPERLLSTSGDLLQAARIFHRDRAGLSLRSVQSPHAGTSRAGQRRLGRRT